jgi:hypothetical protein
MIDTIAIGEPGAATAFDEPLEPTEVPMPIRPASVTDVLGDLADAVRRRQRRRGLPRHPSAAN